MTGFVSKKISKIQTLGERLAAHRSDLGLSIAKAAKLLNLNSRYLKLFESDAYQQLPADVYTWNILKNYSRLLKLNPDMVVETFKKEKDFHLKTQKQKEQIKVNRFLNFFLNPRLLKYAFVFLIIASVLFYLGYGINRIITPPILLVTSPEKNIYTDKNEIEIAGVTEKEVDLRINDQPLLTDTSGRFLLTVNLLKGLNLIKISAQKKHSKPSIVYRQIIVQ